MPSSDDAKPIFPYFTFIKLTYQ